MPDEQPVAPAAATVGAMDPRAAGALEVARGLGTTGAGVVALWYILSGDITGLREELRDVADDVAALRTDVVRLQVQVEGLRAPPAPPR